MFTYNDVPAAYHELSEEQIRAMLAVVINQSDDTSWYIERCCQAMLRHFKQTVQKAYETL